MPARMGILWWWALMGLISTARRSITRGTTTAIDPNPNTCTGPSERRGRPMTEQAARSLAAVVGGDAVFPMPSSRAWGVVAQRADGRLAVVEEHAGWVYHDRQAYAAYQQDGDPDAAIEAREWGEWNDGEEWAQGLSVVLGSEEYWHSGGGIWLVFYARPDGRFAVIGSESGGIYASREMYEADEY